MTAALRKSLPLQPEEQRYLTRLRETPTVEREVLEELAQTHFGDHPSEAEILHALVVAGRKAIDEHVLAAGYAALAEAEDDEDRAARRAMRARAAQLGD